ncbi:hypothetical protein [Mesorhizobium mediterraneum]|uniref:hypothetical protein n=1 Tax=Mesorhizobium mediterraneum TaxID=43617 RepID=UPI00177B9C1B|nr:hypothetical protein [Mesorhizobium mediterraneum]
MTKDKKAHSFYTGETDQGEFLTVSAESPYFCFHSKSEEEGIATAKRALDFYHSASGSQVKKHISPSRRVTTFVPSRREELLCA